MERERLAKRDQARLPVLQEKREQERAQQLVSDAEDEERMRTSRIFWDLLERCGRVGLLSFYFDEAQWRAWRQLRWNVEVASCTAAVA